jgi:hypothetical protein
MNEAAWSPPEIGCVSICRARDAANAYNYTNRYLGFGDVEVVARLEHKPNRANLLVKTHNSLHAVLPTGHGKKPLPDRLTFVVQLYVFPMPIR